MRSAEQGSEVRAGTRREARRWGRVAAAGVLVVLLGAGCVAPPDGEKSARGSSAVSTFTEMPEDRFGGEPSDAGFDFGRYERQVEVFEHSFPRFAWAAGAEHVDQMAEVSCGVNSDDARTTSFQANVSLISNDPGVAAAVAEKVAQVAEAEGWVVEDATAKQGALNVVFTARHSDAGLVVEVRDRGPGFDPEDHLAAVFLFSACEDRPEGHKMHRSVYDSGYGASDLSYRDSGNGSYGPQRPLDRPEGEVPEPPAGVRNSLER